MAHVCHFRTAPAYLAATSQLGPLLLQLAALLKKIIVCGLVTRDILKSTPLALHATNLFVLLDITEVCALPLLTDSASNATTSQTIHFTPKQGYANGFARWDITKTTWCAMPVQ